MSETLTRLRLRLAAWLVGEHAAAFNVALCPDGGLWAEPGRPIYTRGVTVGAPREGGDDE